MSHSEIHPNQDPRPPVPELPDQFVEDVGIQQTEPGARKSQ